MLSNLRPHSIRARFTLVSGIISLIVFAVIGTGLDLAIWTRIQDNIFKETERVATDWIGSLQPGAPYPPVLKTRINLLQLVDDQGKVVAASTAAAGQSPLSTMRPPNDDRISHGTQCTTRDGCLVLTAIRVPPLETQVLWQGQPHFVYAGMAEPGMLSTHELELLTSAGVLAAAALAAWATWWVVGRALRPVAMIRAKTAEITVSDLSMRVPEPPGCDEIAQLARTSNKTLARLEAAVEQQRQFASVVSHELRSPVAGLHTQLEEALLYPTDVDPMKTITTALSTTERLQAIIDDLLVLARIRSAPPAAPEPIDLGALITEEVATRVHGTPVRTHTTGRVTVLGNKIQLIGVLNNLLVNAQRHADTSVEVTTTRTSDHAVITVTDDGPGIAPHDRERVFEPFIRLEDGRRRDPGGSGLGLAISRAVITAHHGTIEIEDSPRGARFVIRLPLIPAGERTAAMVRTS
ncbi:HAMP domain-containing sensor histidine kinase [Planotetraspora mira]|uniref:HAMP domain-containing sensor histidine kinase n=2 Tax=Planotetraspora mira TaxID=58121 RepID=UPI0036712EA8